MLTAALALAGFYFYVFIYTRWLKRSTPQNIVIGGAAGAFPPLVGWAAVTNRVDLFAVYLFLIIFYWTPPHFWALALLKQKDYGNAGVPMAPLVWGETRDEAADVLVHADPHSAHAAAVLLSARSASSTSCSAVVLDAMFLAEVVRVMRATEWTKLAWKLYKFSLLYLALIFAAMVVDRACTDVTLDRSPAARESHRGGCALQNRSAAFFRACARFADGSPSPRSASSSPPASASPFRRSCGICSTPRSSSTTARCSTASRSG